MQALEALEHPLLKKIPTLRHAFFTCAGGVSEGKYSSLNCGYGSQDERVKIEENRRRAAAHFGAPATALVSVKNKHGPRVVELNQPWLKDNQPEADAIVTRNKKVILASDSADCAIVLFADPEAEVIGLAHAGWRGAKTGVLQATVQQMVKLGAHPQRMVAVFGACIHQESYEVSEVFYQDFLKDSLENQAYFKPAGRSNYWMFDLPGFIQNCLENLHLKAVGSLGINTYTDLRFFSWRRSYHAGDQSFGGHLSCIGLKEQ